MHIYNSQSIQIFNGEGASPLCVQALKRELKDQIDERQYIIENFNNNYSSGFNRGNVALTILPGGHAFHMSDSMDELSYKINLAVADNSAFLGSCAGTILTCALYQNPLGKLEKQSPYFNFNPLPFNSLFYVPHSKLTNDPENKTAVEVEWLSSAGHFESQFCKLFHAFGPAIPLDHIPSNVRPNCRVLMKYKTEGTTFPAHNNAAAVFYKPPGNNSTPKIFTGVHPELGVEDIRSQKFADHFNSSNYSHIEKLASQLEDSEQIRKEVCRSWFADLGLRLK